MAEKRVPLNYPPGLMRAGTVEQSAGRWYDANFVRFIAGTRQPIGGWRRVPGDQGNEIAALTGVPRAILGWRAADAGVHIAVGTTSKLHVVSGGVLRDITPAGFTTGRVDTIIPQVGGAAFPSSKYGEGAYGSGRYGEGSTTAPRQEADTWQFDTFGDYLAAVCTSDKKLYVWLGNYAVLPTVPAGAPSSALAVVTTPERFLFALGADGNIRRVRWPSQESITDWTPAATNTAGDFDLPTDGKILCGRRTRRETLIFTDCDLWVATYIGGEFVYRFDQAGRHCGIISPNAVAVFGTNAMWMGFDRFFTYDGFVKDVPCEVHDYVFSDFNRTQAVKVCATTVSRYGEVWFFYPSASSTEIDRYVCYNHVEGHWSLGKLARTAVMDASATEYPVFVTADGLMYEHEFGDDRGSEVPYLEGGPFKIGDGDQLMDVLGLIPDEKSLGDVQVTLYSKLEKMGTEYTDGPFSLEEVTDLRFQARYVRPRFVQNKEVSWRVGVPDLVVSPAGGR